MRSSRALLALRSQPLIFETFILLNLLISPSRSLAHSLAFSIWHRDFKPRTYADRLNLTWGDPGAASSRL
jgi:hypothetical protein